MTCLSVSWCFSFFHQYQWEFLRGVHEVFFFSFYLLFFFSYKMWNLSLWVPTHSALLTHSHGSVGYMGTVFHSTLWKWKHAELQHRRVVAFLSCFPVRRLLLLGWDCGDRRGIRAAAGHRSPCGIRETLLVWRLHPVEVSASKRWK